MRERRSVETNPCFSETTCCETPPATEEGISLTLITFNQITKSNLFIFKTNPAEGVSEPTAPQRKVAIELKNNSYHFGRVLDCLDLP